MSVPVGNWLAKGQFYNLQCNRTHCLMPLRIIANSVDLGNSCKIFFHKQKSNFQLLSNPGLYIFHSALWLFALDYVLKF